jgi:hypothetical protein
MGVILEEIARSLDYLILRQDLRAQEYVGPWLKNILTPVNKYK